MVDAVFYDFSSDLLLFLLSLLLFCKKKEQAMCEYVRRYVIMNMKGDYLLFSFLSRADRLI